jgi:DNA-binding beta-propeller fold protein YncE
MSIRRLVICLSLAFLAVVMIGIPFRSQLSSASATQTPTVLAGRNVNMVSGTTLPGGDPWLQRQNEPTIAVSSRNPMHLLAGANDYRTVDMPQSEGELPGKTPVAMVGDAWLGVFTSSDGGESWTSTMLPGFPQDSDSSNPLKGNGTLANPGYHTAADPVVRSGPNGIFYYSGIAFNRDTNLGVVFVARFIDNNNQEHGNTIQYLDTKIIATGTATKFLDKPWIAIDQPRAPMTNISVNGQSIPRHNVYIAYSAFSGTGSTQGDIMFARSSDCGTTWGAPIKISTGNYAHQGATIAIKPVLGEVLVAWRRFAQTGKMPDSIFVAQSFSRGLDFQSPIKVADIAPFDQPTTDGVHSLPGTANGYAFRINSYPTMTVDKSGHVYLAWSQRGVGPSGDARIMLSYSYLGTSWSTPLPVANLNEYGQTFLGHQIMPSFSFSAGKLILIWYDQRHDVNGFAFGFNPWIIDSLPYRHTMDVWAAAADTAAFPNLSWKSTQVSRYLYAALKDDGGNLVYEGNNPVIFPVQFNCVNYPLFKGGTNPFDGDYIDVAASPSFRLDSWRNWIFNTDDSNSPEFHVAWTDNRDVRPPANGDWTTYTPATSTQNSIFISSYHPACAGGNAPGMRNQNIYTSRITWGIEAGSPVNDKPLNLPGGIARAFVVYVKNNTGSLRSFRLTIAAQPNYGQASFLQFGLLASLNVDIAPYSTISRPVFISSSDPNASVTVNINEINASGSIITGGLSSSVLINGDPTNPNVAGTEETHDPNIVNSSNPNIVNWSAGNPNIVNPNIVNPNIVNPNIVNPNIVNPNIVNPNIVNPNIVNPNIVNPNIVNPNIVNYTITNPNIVNPNIVNPNIVNPNIVNATPADVSATDVEWTITNAGSATTSYTLKTLAKKSPPDGVYTQLLVYRVHKTPAVGIDACELKEEPHHELVLNLINPNIVNPNIVNPNIVNPNIVNSSIENATFQVSPEEEIIVDLRVLNTGIPGSTSQVQEFINSLGFAVTSQAVNSTDVANGIQTPPSAASMLVIGTGSLPDGFLHTGYLATLSAYGGTGPYSWSLNSGTLPPGLQLGATGIISGTPTASGPYHFIVRVDDARGQFATQQYSIYVNPGSTPSGLAIVTTSPLPKGVQGQWYGATLEATGGVLPRTWSLVSGSTLPSGLKLDSGGIISGTPAVSGTFSFNVRVVDKGGSSVTKPLQLTVNALHLAFVQQPSNTGAGAVMTPSVTVEIRDQGGNVVTTATDTVILSLLNAGTATLGGTKSQAAIKGKATFSNLTIDLAGSGYMLGANSGSLKEVDSNAFSITALVLDHFDIGPSAISTQIIGTPFPITITAKDSGGNVVTTYSGTNTLSLNFYPYTNISPANVTLTNGVWHGNVTITAPQYGVVISTSGGGKSGQCNTFDVLYPGPYSTISGQITYNGAPFTTGAHVDFSMQDYGAGQRYPIPPSAFNPATGTFSIPNVRSGTYAIYLRTDTNTPPNYLPYPGDYQGGSNQFVVSAPAPVTQNAAVDKIIHLTAPVDNNPPPAPGIPNPPPYPGYPAPITFQWQAIPEATTYEIYVFLSQDNPYQILNDHYYHELGIAGTQKSLILPVSDPNQHYEFELIARNGSNTPIGELSIVLTGSGGGIYGFRGSYLFKVTVGAPTQIRVETAADGSGTVAGPLQVAAGSSVTVYAVSRDAAGNFVANVSPDSWSLANRTGGVAGGDLVPSTVDNKSATFTGHLLGSAVIHVAKSGLTSADSGLLTVAGGAIAHISVETKADGTGVVVPAQEIAAGSPIAVYAISRDAVGNYLENSVVDSWSLINKTGGVVDGDLVTAGDMKSATFTGHSSGTGQIHVAKGVLNSVDSGVLTVVKAEEWVATYDGPVSGNDQVAAMTVDSSGNTYVTGSSAGNGTGNDYATVKYNSAGVQHWVPSPRYTGPVNPLYPQQAIAVDSWGNVYVAGSAGGAIVTIKYNSSGSQQWVATYNGYAHAAYDGAYGIAVNSSGDVYVVGMIKITGDSSAYATVKYDMYGNQLWVAMYYGKGGISQPCGLALDFSGNVYVAGTITGSNTGNPDYATVKYDTNGNQLWVATYDDSNKDVDIAYALAVDFSGNVYVAGVIYGDYGTIKYDTNGNSLWVKTYNGPGNGSDSGRAIAVDSSGNVYVTGMSTSASGDYDCATIKYDANGNQLWATTYNGPGNGSDSGQAIHVDPLGNVYVSGTSVGSGSGQDYATIKYNNLGIEQWVFRYNGLGNGDDDALVNGIDSLGNVYVTGWSTGSGTGHDYTTLKYAQSFPSTLMITSNALDSGYAGALYAATIWAFGGSGSRSWSKISGTLPPGMDLSAITGKIAGTPTTPGTYNFTVQVADGNVTATKDLSITIQNEAYDFVTKWGSSGSGDGQFNQSIGIRVDSSGNVYVSDGNHRIQKFTSDGTFVTKWGSYGSGNGQFNAPYDIAVDSSGNVYVADTYNSRIQKFLSDGTYVAQWGSNGSGDGQFNYPTGIAVDSSGNVYVADVYNNRVQKFLSDGTYVAQWGSLGSGDGQFNGPHSIAVDSSGNVYVTDISNSRIQKFTSDGTFVTKWGSSGSGDGQFNQLWGIAVDSSEYVYVADRNNHRIQKFTSGGTFVTKWGSSGSGDGQFQYPSGIAVDSSGYVYVADTFNNRIQKFQKK